MISTLLPLAAAGFAIGFRHAFEPDHLAAVATLAARQGSAREAAWLGVAWGAGHTAAVAAVAGLLIVPGWQLPETLRTAAELVVAALLVALGGTVLMRHGRRHLQRYDAAHLAAHAHGVPHVHPRARRDARHSLGFGLAHGVAGGGAVVVLLVATAGTRAAQGLSLAAFGAGTIAGMLAVSAAVALAVRRAGRRQPHWSTRLHLGAAAASVLAGCVLAALTLGLR